MAVSEFPRIFESVRIGSMELKNRIVMPPMVSNLCAGDGTATDRFIAYHQARAKGGVGLIIIEATYVHKSGKGFNMECGIDHDRTIPGLKKLADAVHLNGTKIAVQLYHGGRQTRSAVTGMDLLAPSPIPCPLGQEMPKEITRADIEMIVEAFAQGARRAKEAGFDAVEIHGAHGYLINEFLSAYSNKRTDEYGGSFENRTRFPREVIRSVRAAVGKDYPIIYRLTSDEFVEGGLTIEDTKLFAKVLVEAGVDAIHVSGGVYESAAYIIQPAAIRQCLYADNAGEIKQAINSRVPVIVAGRIKEPAAAEQILKDGKADLVAMGRALLADPEMPNKLARGELSEVRKCIGCNQGCIDRLFQGLDVNCMVNATAAHELEYDLAPADGKKKVMVIGSGPAGLEAARVAALRGHDVVLYEKENELGGQLHIACVSPFKGEIQDLTNFLIRAVERLGVRIIKGEKADIAAVRAVAPDAVILAAGSEPIVPDIPGIASRKVVDSHDVLKGKAETGGRVLIIGGGMVGCETAEYLVKQGRKVTLVEMLDDIATDVGPLVRALLLARIAQEKITVLTGSKVVDISEDGVVVEKSGNRSKIEGIDSVVLAVGAKSCDSLKDDIEKSGIRLSVIGDCAKPGKIFEAIHEGFKAGCNL